MKKAKVTLRCLSLYEDGDVEGYIINEKNESIGGHLSSDTSWLRNDLMNKIKNKNYEIIDKIDDDYKELLKMSKKQGVN